MPRLLLTRSNNNNTVQCKKHPKHKQSPGVCSLCLVEKLARVSTTSTSDSRGQKGFRAREYYCSSSSVSSSEDESSYASSSVSPMHEEGQHRRIVSDVNLNVTRYLDKSKSMPLDEEKDGKKKIVRGFWSKLLRPKRNSNNNNRLKNLENSNKNKVFMSQPLDVSSSSRVVAY